jgi:hypothetical protein
MPSFFAVIRNGRGVKIRRFENDRFRIGHDLAVCTAHDARHGDGLFRVRNDKHLRAEHAELPVERVEALALPGAADRDAAPVEAGVVEGRAWAGRIPASRSL